VYKEAPGFRPGPREFTTLVSPVKMAPYDMASNICQALSKGVCAVPLKVQYFPRDDAHEESVEAGGLLTASPPPTLSILLLLRVSV